MNAVIHNALDSTLANELVKIYEIECRFCALLPKITKRLKSKVLRDQLNAYLDQVQLTLGKLFIIFHLTGNHARSDQENKLVSDLLHECERIFAMPPEAYDIIMSIQVIQVIGHKLSCYNVINLCAIKLENRPVLSIVSELLSHEQSTITQVRNFLDDVELAFQRLQ